MNIPAPAPPSNTTPSLAKITWLKPGLIGFLIGLAFMGIIWCIFRNKKKDTFKKIKAPTNLQKPQVHNPKPQVHNPKPQVKSILKKSVSWEGQDFIPSPKFHGNKPGYAFKKGDKGQGYYRDG